MLTPEQEKWVESLSDKAVLIVPYDPKAKKLFIKAKKKIQNILGPEVTVEHVGASSFGISGQDEIDVSIVTNKGRFPDYIKKLEAGLGPIKSVYPDRVRFEVKEEGKKIDLKLIDVDHPNYLNSKAFEKYLKSHHDELNRYRILKEECNGVTVKEYYRRKIEFINEILLKI